ncbi:MAG: hypothetical protein KF858_04465 [Candidatus Sumerlaeia bacterium]|nr:hypothetical protein [Candidatus Sumerlaeia bacterium]
MTSTPPTPEAPELPRGFWAGIDYILMQPDRVLEMLRHDIDTGRLVRLFLTACLAGGAFYGAVMGATNLLQGTAIPMQEKLLFVLSSALKVPFLFLLCLAIVLPPIYVSNAFVGAKLRFRQMVAILAAGVGMQVILLASMATVALFFALTTRSYHFIKLMHVLFFCYAGVAGLSFVARTIQSMQGTAGRPTPAHVFALWLMLYGFVGIQLAWTLRPFVGSPNEPFQVFREREGNFVESVFYSTGRFLSGDDGRGPGSSP